MAIATYSPVQLAGIQYIDFAHDRDEGMQKLVGAITSPPSTKSPPLPDTPAPPAAQAQDSVSPHKLLEGQITALTGRAEKLQVLVLQSRDEPGKAKASSQLSAYRSEFQSIRAELDHRLKQLEGTSLAERLKSVADTARTTVNDLARLLDSESEAAQVAAAEKEQRSAPARFRVQIDDLMNRVDAVRQGMQEAQNRVADRDLLLNELQRQHFRLSDLIVAFEQLTTAIDEARAKKELRKDVNKAKSTIDELMSQLQAAIQETKQAQTEELLAEQQRLIKQEQEKYQKTQAAVQKYRAELSDIRDKAKFAVDQYREFTGSRLYSEVRSSYRYGYFSPYERWYAALLKKDQPTQPAQSLFSPSLSSSSLATSLSGYRPIRSRFGSSYGQDNADLERARQQIAKGQFAPAGYADLEQRFKTAKSGITSAGVATELHAELEQTKDHVDAFAKIIRDYKESVAKRQAAAEQERNRVAAETASEFEKITGDYAASSLSRAVPRDWLNLYIWTYFAPVFISSQKLNYGEKPVTTMRWWLMNTLIWIGLLLPPLGIATGSLPRPVALPEWGNWLWLGCIGAWLFALLTGKYVGIVSAVIAFPVAMCLTDPIHVLLMLLIVSIAGLVGGGGDLTQNFDDEALLTYTATGYGAITLGMALAPITYRNILDWLQGPLTGGAAWAISAATLILGGVIGFGFATMALSIVRHTGFTKYRHAYKDSENAKMLPTTASLGSRLGGLLLPVVYVLFAVAVL